MFLFKIDAKDLYTVEEQYTSEIIKLHKNNNDNNICTEICTLMCKIFTFSDFLLHSKLLNDVNNDEKKLPRQFLLYNFEKIFFNVLIIKKAIFFKTLSTTFYYSCNNHPVMIKGNCQCISEETYQDCIEIWKLYMKAKDLDFFKYKIIFHKFKNENLLNHLLYKICESPGSASILY